MDPHSKTPHVVDTSNFLFESFLAELQSLERELSDLTSTPEQNGFYAPQSDFEDEDDELGANSDSSTRIENLRALKELLDSGILTQEEFESEKAKILNS